ncbi:lysophospholipid acyltransferase family protein [Pontiella agarivorans]|uniref:Lysophospholipid acyltransferase family protein n=1 Tax=Pontiella agarivorans TaxID=3038953 RepID=A0ABU5N037_9BACT|nr:lysophospholipid acyltransferase family protein [Pontiella agarivorans]MDZ8119830.1 lysophospholipid acyltransferase family protein [Pontiella agarivorans]
MPTLKRKIKRIIRKIRRAVRRPFEAAGYVFLKWTIPLLPRRMVIGLARFAGWVALRLPIREREVGLKNLDAVFGDSKSTAEKKAILATSLATFTQTMFDVFWFSKNPAKRIADFVTFDPSPLVERFFEDGAVICITAHMGSWEILGQATALRGADLASIAATVKNRTVDRVLIELREKTGQTIIPQKGALKTLISRLRKKGKTAFVLDQHTAPENGGITVDFLGLPMSVSAAPAALAYRTGTPVYFGFSIPDSTGGYRIEITDSLKPPAFQKEADMDGIVQQLTQKIEDRISAQIHKYPQFWLWSYKHWRRQAGGNYPASYPDY